MQQDTWLRIYTTEAQRHHHGKLLHEWLLEAARKQGIPGGTAFRAVAGFGRHGVLHEETFFELAGELPMVVEFIVTPQQAAALLGACKQENLRLFYMQTPVSHGITGA